MTMLIRESEARRRFGGVSRSTFWRLRQDGHVPDPVVIRKKNYWLEAAIDAAITRLAGVNNTSPSSTLLTQEVPDGLVN